MRNATCASACGIVMMLAGQVNGVVVSVNPVADAFVVSAQAGSNYGGAGAMQVAAPGSARGEFQAVLRFDMSACVSSFDSTYGAGQWVIESVTLQLTATTPNNQVFNSQAAGSLAIDWMQNDSWVEGSGMPNTPATNGIMYSTLASFLSGVDEPLGVFGTDGATTGVASYALSLPGGFASDIGAGGLVSLRVYVPQAGVYTFNSRNFATVASRPVLSISAISRPACGTADFDGNGDTGTDADIEAFFACLAGNCCGSCWGLGADFNGDGDVGTDADIEAFFRVLGGHPC